MAAPAPSWDLVQVYGTWNSQNGSRKAGAYKVTILQRVVDATDDVMIPAGVYATGSLSTAPTGKSLDIMAPAVDDADISPRNFAEMFEITFNDGSAPESFYVRPTIAGGPVNLRKITPGSDVGDLQVDPPLTDSQILANASAYTDTQVDAHEDAANPHPIYAQFVDTAGDPLGTKVIVAGAGEPFPPVVVGGLLFYGGS